MLDLTNYKKYYEIKMPEGDILQIQRPTQEFLLKMMRLRDIKEDDIEGALSGIWECAKDILNNNINGKVYDDAYLSEHFDISVISLIITDYTETVLTELSE